MIWPVEPTRRLPEPIDRVFSGDTLHLLAWLPTQPEGPATLNLMLSDGRRSSQSVMLEPWPVTETADTLPRLTAGWGGVGSGVGSGVVAGRCVASMEAGPDDLDMFARWLAANAARLADPRQPLPRWTNWLAPACRTICWRGCGNWSPGARPRTPSWRRCSMPSSGTDRSTGCRATPAVACAPGFRNRFRPP